MGNTPPQQTNTPPPQESQMGTQNTYPSQTQQPQKGTLYHVDRLKVEGREIVYILRDGVYVKCIIVDFPSLYGTTAKYEVLPIGSTKSEKVKQDEVYTDDPELHSNKKFYPQPVQDANTVAVSPKAVPPAVADKSVDPNPTILYEVDPKKINGSHTVYFHDEKKSSTSSKQLLHGRVLFPPSLFFRGTNKYRIQIDGQDTTKNIYYDVEKIYTDNIDLSNKNQVQIRSGGRKSKKVFKNKNKKRKSRKTSKRSRRH
jgi:hypothetical protein